MAQNVVLGLLVALILAWMSGTVQQRLRDGLRRRPALIWCAPVLLTAGFSGAAWLVGAFSLALALMVLVYTAAPVGCAAIQGAGPAARPTALDFGAILLLWLPLELSAGAPLVPRPAQGFLHSVAYGVAILLGLTLFAGFRGMGGLKYNLPRRAADLWLALAAFGMVAPVLIAVGIAIGFIPLWHAPTASAGRMAAAAGIIFIGTALPEEILFRALIQNLLMQRFGENARTLAAASLIFGCAHLNNGPQPLPNWRYMILATIAGVAYGKVFQRASSVTASALLHMLVDWTKHFFF
jgi:uncharacterized protein